MVILAVTLLEDVDRARGQTQSAYAQNTRNAVSGLGWWEDAAGI